MKSQTNPRIPAQPKHFPFMRLAGEIRNLVYEEIVAMCPSVTLKYVPGSGTFRGLYYGLLSSNHTIRKEFLPIWRQNIEHVVLRSHVAAYIDTFLRPVSGEHSDIMPGKIIIDYSSGHDLGSSNITLPYLLRIKAAVPKFEIKVVEGALPDDVCDATCVSAHCPHYGLFFTNRLIRQAVEDWSDSFAENIEFFDSEGVFPPVEFNGTELVAAQRPSL